MGWEISNNHTSLSEIPHTAAISIATNTNILMLEEMKQERKETAAQMKQLAAMLLAAAKNKTPIPADPPSRSRWRLLQPNRHPPSPPSAPTS